jgi:hypothetical protein
MDPISALGLVASCLSIANGLRATTDGIKKLIRFMQHGDKNLVHLVSQLELFEATIDELYTWFESKPKLSPSLSRTIRSCLNSCEIIVQDIGEHVVMVSPAMKGSSSKFKRNFTMLWKDDMIKEHQRLIQIQFSAMSLIVGLRAM